MVPKIRARSKHQLTKRSSTTVLSLAGSVCKFSISLTFAIKHICELSGPVQSPAPAQQWHIWTLCKPAQVTLHQVVQWCEEGGHFGSREGEFGVRKSGIGEPNLEGAERAKQVSAMCYPCLLLPQTSWICTSYVIPLPGQNPSWLHQVQESASMAHKWNEGSYKARRLPSKHGWERSKGRLTSQSYPTGALMSMECAMHGGVEQTLRSSQGKGTFLPIFQGCIVLVLESWIILDPNSCKRNKADNQGHEKRMWQDQEDK